MPKPLKPPEKRRGRTRSQKPKHETHRPVGFTRTGTGHLIVAAGLDRNARLSLLVDSGASHTVLAASSRALADVDLSALETAEAKAAGGEMPPVRMIRLGTLRIGTWRFRGVTAAIMELGTTMERLGTTIDGILGQDVLARHGLSLDLGAGKIAFASRLPRASSRRPRCAHFSAALNIKSEKLIEVEVRAQAKSPIAGLLDLGAAQTLANGAGVAYLGGRLLPADPKRPPPRGMGADERLLDVQRAVVAPFAIGGLKFPSRALIVADLPVFRILGYENRPVVLLGLDLFEDKRLTINFKTRRLTITLPQPGRRKMNRCSKPMESNHVA
jgi:hypothetical protein